MLNRHRKDQQSTTRRKPRGDRRDRVVPVPSIPQIDNLALTCGVTLRFVKSSWVGPENITWRNVLDCILFSTTSTVAYDLFEAVKVREVRVWTPSGAVGSTTLPPIPTTASIEFLDSTLGALGDQKIHSCTSVGIEPAFVRGRPSAKSQASQWHNSSATIAFQLNAPVGSVVDVDCTFRATYGGNISAQNNGTGLTVGAIYMRGLDGNPASSSRYIPSYGNIA
jgi:hypothetical protein